VKIQRFALWGLGVFFVILIGLSSGFYHVERTGTLRYLSEGINQSIFRLEGDIQKVLQEQRLENVQTLLDKASSIDNAISTLSLSLDGKSIAVSSSRSLTGKLIEGKYDSVTKMYEGIISNGGIHYSSEVPYFLGAEKKTALLLIDLNKEFVYERFNQIAVIYGVVLFIVLGIFAMIVFGGVREWIIRPLEWVTRGAQTRNMQDEKYLIEEIAILNQTISNSFDSMQEQQNNLADTLDKLRYLDGILRTVADINQFLITAKDIDDLLNHSCKRLAEHPGYELCWIALKEGNSLSIQAYSNDITGYLHPNIKIPIETAQGDTDPCIRALRENSTVVMEHLEHEKSFGAWHFIAEKGRFGSLISIPMVSGIDSPPIGVITIYAKHSEGFETKEISMLEELAADIGFAVESFRQREQLRYHLTTDPISDLPNRFSLVEALGEEKICALAIINIDRFSDINEVYGISIGDSILAGYGHWLSLKTATNKDILLFKMGSDEYALIYKNCVGDLDSFIAFLKEITLSTQRETFIIEGVEIVLTITIGVAPISDRVLEHATAALKLAKRQRHSLEVFSLGSKHEQEINIAWYKRIKEAIEEERIVPYFQPIVDNFNGNIIKYEALVRLIERDGTVITPYLFLEIAKKTKLYPELTKIMIDKVVEIFKSFSLPVSLNLSTQDLINPELADYLENVILENQMGKLLIFEILESEGIENYSDVSAFIDRFKAIGCQFAIDDFGSGYSNFDHLLKLNIDTLKIDGALIKNLPHDRNSQIFVKHICEFAHEMGMGVIAEFVANEAIYHQVKEIGIDASQGYYFYEPSPTLISSK